MKIDIEPITADEKREALYSPDEETLEDDVNYGIADCRKRLRSQRSTHRAQHHPPKDGSSGVTSTTAGRVGSYAEVLANSMNQSSLSRLVECLLEPAITNTRADEASIEREEALIT